MHARKIYMKLLILSIFNIFNKLEDISFGKLAKISSLNNNIRSLFNMHTCKICRKILAVAFFDTCFYFKSFFVFLMNYKT